MTRTRFHARAKRTTGSVPMPLVVACLAMVLSCAWVDAQAQTGGPDANVWVPAMKRVNAKFTGEQGTLALFGDSITVSRAFWFGLPHTRKNASAEMTKAFELVNHYMLEDCWDRRGAKYGNEGMMTIRWAHQNVDTWLKDLNPEVALIMFGTNDLDINDNCRYPINGPTTGKWTTHTMKVTRGGPLKAGHKVDDIFFFAGPPGSKTTRLMVDNVRLGGSDE